MIELIRHVLAIISMVPGLVSPHLGWTADPPPCVSSASCVARLKATNEAKVTT